MIKFKQNELAVITQFDENVSAESLVSLNSWVDLSLCKLCVCYVYLCFYFVTFEQKSIGQSHVFSSIPNLKKTAAGDMSKIEFVMGLLEMMGKVRMGDVRLASSLFDRIDSNDDGLISSEEMEELMKSKVGNEETEKDSVAY